MVSRSHSSERMYKASIPSAKAQNKAFLVCNNHFSLQGKWYFTDLPVKVLSINHVIYIICKYLFYTYTKINSCSSVDVH